MTSLIDTFAAAARAHESAVREWNRAVDPSARTASGLTDSQWMSVVQAARRLDLTSLREAHHAAARALIADAAGRHLVEERAIIWLRLGTRGWLIDGPTVDGLPLEGLESGPTNQACSCRDRRECVAVCKAADSLPLPTAAELLDLLANTRQQSLNLDASRTPGGQPGASCGSSPATASHPIAQALSAIARALSAADRHLIEGVSLVPLRLSHKGWLIEVSIFDQSQLKGVGPQRACDEDPRDAGSTHLGECESLWRAARLIPLPDADQLLALLRAANEPNPTLDDPPPPENSAAQHFWSSPDSVSREGSSIGAGTGKPRGGCSQAGESSRV